MTADAANRETEAAVHRLVLASGGTVTRVPIRTIPEVATLEPEPLAGIKAAHRVELVARGLAHRYIQAAREAGHSWREIGEALALTVPYDDPAVAAWDYAALAGSVYRRSAMWVCPSCRGTILDQGPDAGANPADTEPGHADGCERLAGAVAAHEAEWANEDQDS